jgi:hypothetical protein
MTTSAPSRTRASSDAKSRVASASEMSTTGLIVFRLYITNFKGIGRRFLVVSARVANLPLWALVPFVAAALRRHGWAREWVATVRAVLTVGSSSDDAWNTSI